MDNEQSNILKHPTMRKLDNAAFELLCWRRGGTSFNCQLFDLLTKADAKNTARLAVAYPVEVEIFLSWRRSKTEQEFFKRHGLSL